MAAAPAPASRSPTVKLNAHTIAAAVAKIRLGGLVFGVVVTGGGIHWVGFSDAGLAGVAFGGCRSILLF